MIVLFGLKNMLMTLVIAFVLLTVVMQKEDIVMTKMVLFVNRFAVELLQVGVKLVTVIRIIMMCQMNILVTPIHVLMATVIPALMPQMENVQERKLLGQLRIQIMPLWWRRPKWRWKYHI